MTSPVAAARAALGGLWEEPPAVAVILGSGFAAAARDWPIRERRAYSGIPGFPACGVQGHAGELLVVDTPAGGAAIFSGRLHAYEGLAPAEVVFPVDLAAALGARAILLTAAAGGIRPDLAPGDLVLAADHINLAGWVPPVGDGFLDLTEVYDPRLRSALRDTAHTRGVPLPEAVLACVCGPVYETPAEVRMLGRLGADLVCMSTVPEAIRARALGLPVAALLCVANRAAGLAPDLLSHADVLDRVEGSVARHAPWLLQGIAAMARSA